MTEIELENLPVHEIKRLCKEKHPDIKLKNTWKKHQLIKLLVTGKSPEPEKVEPKRAPVLEKKEDGNLICVLPEEIKPQLEELSEKGLKWEIDKEYGCVNFRKGRFTSCANLDQSAYNILRSAQDCFPKSAPVELSRQDRHPHLD